MLPSAVNTQGLEFASSWEPWRSLHCIDQCCRWAQSQERFHAGRSGICFSIYLVPTEFIHEGSHLESRGIFSENSHWRLRLRNRNRIGIENRNYFGEKWAIGIRIGIENHRSGGSGIGFGNRYRSMCLNRNREKNWYNSRRAIAVGRCDFICHIMFKRTH